MPLAEDTVSDRQARTVFLLAFFWTDFVTQDLPERVLMGSSGAAKEARAPHGSFPLDPDGDQANFIPIRIDGPQIQRIELLKDLHRAVRFVLPAKELAHLVERLRLPETRKHARIVEVFRLEKPDQASPGEKAQ